MGNQENGKLHERGESETTTTHRKKTVASSKLICKLKMQKINHAPTASLLLVAYNQMKLFLGAIDSHTSIKIKLGLESK